jgi:hypothetical protein
MIAYFLQLIGQVSAFGWLLNNVLSRLGPAVENFMGEYQSIGSARQLYSTNWLALGQVSFVYLSLIISAFGIKGMMLVPFRF